MGIFPVLSFAELSYDQQGSFTLATLQPVGVVDSFKLSRGGQDSVTVKIDVCEAAFILK